MKFDAFIGGSYESQAVTADQEQTVNWYPELLESPGATARAVLYPTPGVTTIGTLGGAGTGRGHFYMNGREFAVIGDTFLEIDAAGGITTRGTVAEDSNPATISSNGELGNQLFITSGRKGYIYDLGANSLTQIPALNGKATMGDQLDGYFLALDANSATLFISKLGDGLTWDTGLDFAQRSIAPDRWRAMRVVGRFIWLFGETTTEVWYDTGANFPFAPHPSGFCTYGITAPFSTAIIGTDVVWLGAAKTGRTCVLRASGFTPEVISNYPLETAIQEYSTISRATSDVYSERGHTFYLLNFDWNNVTWAWDSETKMWCERGTWLSELNRFSSWRPRFYAFAFNEHRMLDISSSAIYQVSSDVNTDVDGLYIRRVRRAPALPNEMKRVFYSSFELDLEPGLGTTNTSKALTETARFTWSQGENDARVSFHFGVLTKFSVNNYAWDFGDGQTDSGPTANITSNVYAWPPDATFTVTLTVTGPTFGTVVLSADVTTNRSGGMVGSSDLYTFTVTSGILSQGSNPMVMLRLSNDGGKTFVSEQQRSAGKAGEYLRRVRWNRLGMARRRVFEVSVTDPIPWRLVGCYLTLSQAEVGKRG